MKMFLTNEPQGYISKTLSPGYDEVYVRWGNWWTGTATLEIGGTVVQTLSASRGAAVYKGTYSPGSSIKFTENGIFWVGEIWVR